MGNPLRILLKKDLVVTFRTRCERRDGASNELVPAGPLCASLSEAGADRVRLDAGVFAVRDPRWLGSVILQQPLLAADLSKPSWKRLVILR